MMSGVEETAIADRVGLSVPLKACYAETISRTKDLDYFTNKRLETEKACGLWLDLLACNWSATKVGAQICTDLRRDPSGDAAIESLKACFGTKSPNTLQKRASSLRRFYKWHSQYCKERDVYIDPIPLREDDVWHYFQHLRSGRIAEGRGYTTPGTFLETVRFAKFTIGLGGALDVLESGRLLGLAALDRREKGPTRQAPPMEVEHLRKLHEILASDADKTDRLGAGTFLICIYARARWSDIRFIHHVEVEARRNGCLVLYTTEHKTPEVGLRREQYLPLVVPWDGVVRTDWLKIYLELYESVGLNIHGVPLGPLMPAPLVGGGFGARPLSTSEASIWLRLLLQGTSNAQNFRSHSLKATILSWCARSGMDKEVRAVLGHHCSSLNGSEVVYAGELQTRPIRKLQMLLKNIRLGLGFDEIAEQGTLISSTPCVLPPRPNAFTPALPSGPLAVEPEAGREPGAEIEHALEVMNVAEENESIKEEHDIEEQSRAFAENLSLFPLPVVREGLIEIESSSGSDTDSSSESSEEELEGRGREPESYVEHVPPGQVFVRNTKSGLVHCAKSSEGNTKCKQKIGGNFKVLDRVIFLKMPKCLNCFPKDPDRIRKLEDLVNRVDAAVKRARGQV